VAVVVALIRQHLVVVEAVVAVPDLVPVMDCPAL
jgi:hypothetical protein